MSKKLKTLIIIIGTSLIMNTSEVVNNYRFINFRESNEAFVNPYMGYAPWASSITKGSGIESDISLAFVLLYWKDFEPRKDFYDFDTFEAENNLKYLSSHHIKLIIRVVCDYPTSEKHIDIPQWLYNEMNGAGTFYDNDGLAGFVPDYGNAYFMKRHSLMIQALGKRYDDSQDIAFIQLGSLGHWGEWHNIATPDSPFPEAHITDLYVEHYLNAFQQKKMQMRRPYDITRENKIGLYNDMTGHDEATSLWLGWVKDYDMVDFYNHSPSGGEFASTYSLDKYFGEMYSEVKQMISDSHMTFIGNLPPKDIKSKENIDDLKKTMGYRFTIKDILYTYEIQTGDIAYIRLSIENIGIAPFYYKWPLYYLFYDQEGNLTDSFELPWDIRKIYPGKRYTHNDGVPIGLPSGDYTIKLGIFNPDTNTADVHFANMEVGKDRLLTVGTMKIIA